MLLKVLSRIYAPIAMFESKQVHRSALLGPSREFEDEKLSSLLETIKTESRSLEEAIP